MRQLLAGLRGHCLKPPPGQDIVRWLLGGSVNLFSTLEPLRSIDLINTFHPAELPLLNVFEVEEFVRGRLSERVVDFTPQVPGMVAEMPDRPVPCLFRMVTTNLYRLLGNLPLTSSVIWKPAHRINVSGGFESIPASQSPGCESTA